MVEIAASPGQSEVEFDHWTEPIVSDPWQTWDDLRSKCPVAHTPAHGGFWVLTRYDDVYATALDTSHYSSDGDGNGVGVPPQEMPLYPVDLDAPEHTKYRALLNPWLNPRTVGKLEPWVRTAVREALQELPTTGVVDIAEAFTLPVPRLVAFKVLGFPEEHRTAISGWLHTLATSRGGTEEASAMVGKTLSEIITQRRSAPRRSDVLDALVHGSMDGKPLDDSQVMSLLLLLLFGGLGTTSAAVAGSLIWLAQHPEDRQGLIADPTLLDTAVDEFVRWTSPVAHIGRTATEDVGLRGCPIEAGDRVLLSFGAANRDPEQFEHPERVILDRRPNRHIGFGIGPHRCVGSHLARLQLRVILAEFLAWMPDFRLAPGTSTGWAPGESRVIVNLPLELGVA